MLDYSRLTTLSQLFAFGEIKTSKLLMKELEFVIAPNWNLG